MSLFSRNLIFFGKSFVKNFHTEFNKGSKNGLNVDTRSQTDGRTGDVSTKEANFIVLVSNQRDAAFVLLGLLSLYTFRTRFASIFRSNTQNCNGSHQCVSMRVRWRSPISSYYSWRWTRTAPETCRVIINQVKQKLHLVGYLLIQYYKNARYHEHKKKPGYN